MPLLKTFLKNSKCHHWNIPQPCLCQDLLGFAIIYPLKNLKQQQDKPTVIRFKDKQVLFVDRMGIYQVKGLKSPVVVLNESPKVNMIRLIDELQPSLIVADGSNYKSIVAMWEKTCLETTTPFWDTRQHGAYILNWLNTRISNLYAWKVELFFDLLVSISNVYQIYTGLQTTFETFNKFIPLLIFVLSCSKKRSDFLHHSFIEISGNTVQQLKLGIHENGSRIAQFPI